MLPVVRLTSNTHLLLLDRRSTDQMLYRVGQCLWLLRLKGYSGFGFPHQLGGVAAHPIKIGLPTII